MIGLIFTIDRDCTHRPTCRCQHRPSGYATTETNSKRWITEVNTYLSMKSLNVSTSCWLSSVWDDLNQWIGQRTTIDWVNSSNTHADIHSVNLGQDLSTNNSVCTLHNLVYLWFIHSVNKFAPYHASTKLLSLWKWTYLFDISLRQSSLYQSCQLFTPFLLIIS